MKRAGKLKFPETKANDPKRRLATSRDTRMREAMLALLTEGSRRKASAATGIPYRTIGVWAASAEGKRVLEEVKSTFGHELAQTFARVAKKCLAKFEALVDGDEVKAKDLIIGAGIAVDKLRALTPKTEAQPGEYDVEVVFGGARPPPVIDTKAIPTADDEDAPEHVL